MAVNDAKRLGYGGSAEIDGIQVLITSGNMDTASAVSYLEPYDALPTAAESRSKVEHADGTESYTASISFDVTTNFLTILTTTKLFARGYKFDVGIHDGESAQVMTDCYVQSLTLSGGAEGIVTASLTAVSANAPVPSLSVKNAYIRESRSALPLNNVPLGYWYSGNTDVRDWSLSMNQNASPVYTNQDVVSPRYIKFGLIDFNLSVTTYESVLGTSSITIATNGFTLTGNTSAEGFAFGGTTDLGNYTHVFETSAAIGFSSGGSDGTIIS
jgi:hypothetical protein